MSAKLFKVFETPDELNLDFLPPSFVIKLTFQSMGRGIVIIKDGIDQRTQKPYELDEIKEFMKKYTLSPDAIVKYHIKFEGCRVTSRKVPFLTFRSWTKKGLSNNF